MDCIRCIIVDDEFPARVLLKEFIEKVPTLELVGSYKSGLEALPVIQTGGVDLMFLDIQMPDITGTNFLKMLTVKPFVIFTTAYSEYAIESYQLDVLDYLLKPFSFDRFMQSVGKAMQRLTTQTKESPAPKNEATATQSAAPEPEEHDPNANIMLVKADHKIHRVRYDSIIYIEGLREYVTIFCENEKIITLESLRNLEDTLPPNMFIRVHKSYIVRIDKIRALYGSQLKIDGVQQYIPVGKSYKDDVQKRFFEK
ncbi:MAG: LytTR family DNA-binding domain-containing protein [Marinilabiliaceae bacterium]|nr:LytTR family DNA-binding domain-containing protein [Marinilabiliaceae bacterium]